MQAVKGYYKNQKIQLLEPFPETVREAELSIVIHPVETKPAISPYSNAYIAKKMCSEEEFRAFGLSAFLDTDDDANVDWEEWFGIK